MKIFKFIISVLFFTFSLSLYSASTNTINIHTQRNSVLFSLISELPKIKLKKICKKLGISPLGRTKDIRKRIINYLELNKTNINSVFTNIKSETNNNTEEEGDKIVIETANEGEYLQVDNSEEEILSAKGNVHLRYKNILMRADELRLNVKTKEMLCSGNVILWDGSKELIGEKVVYNLDTKDGIIYNGKSEIGQIVYYGEKIKKIEKGPYIIHKARFTSCKNHKPHYYLEATKIWVYPNDKIIMFNAYYIVSGVKLFWIPLFLRFEKGTGIITSWGKRKVDGWYMQNTYITKFMKNDEVRFKFDHYQKRGEYAGIDYRLKTKSSEVIMSASGAYDKKLFGDSNINPATGKMERKYRGKFSFRNRYTFNYDKKNKSLNTTLKMNIFRQSDYSFVQDFERFRIVKPGFHYYQNPIYNNDIYNQSSQNWYINLFDRRKNSTLLIKADWNFQWNSIKTNYFLSTVTAPYIKYSLNGSILDYPNTSKSNFHFNPKINYNTFISFQHNDYYDYYGNYLKSVDYRQIYGNLSKTFNIVRFINYNIGLGIGDYYYLPYNVSDSEKNNYERNSYTYGKVNETLQLGVSSFNFNFAHNYQWRFKEYSVDSVYGKVVAHSLSLSHLNRIISGITYKISTGYDLKYPKNEKFKGFVKDRFSDLNSYLYINIIKNMSINDNYRYSIRNSQSIVNNLSASYRTGDFILPLNINVKSLSFSSSWRHYFPNPISSKMNFDFNINVSITKYWNFSISTHSENNKLYLYSKSLSEKYGVGRYEHRNFFEDLFNSVNIFEPDKMKSSYFKLKRASVSVNHDLHCWQLSFGYSLNQRFFYYGTESQYPYFEHSFWFKINMKFESNIGIDEKFRTEPPTVVSY